MIVAPLLVAAARRHLEARYGLALDGVGDEQIGAAIEGAVEDPWIDPSDAHFLSRVIDRLPIDESWLFREDPLWEWLRDDAGPALLDAALVAGRPVRALSLGCSGGQEPFSLAILFQGLLEARGVAGSAVGAYVQVTGIDSSPARVEAARSGIVPAWSVQRARPDWLRGRLAAADEAGSRWRVDAAAAGSCRFEVGNLVEVAERGNAALAGYDLVLCRHVLIYFRAADAERLAALLGDGLDPGALLALSAPEAHLLGSRLAPTRHLAAGRAGGTSSLAPAGPRARAGRRRHAPARMPSAGELRAGQGAAARAPGGQPPGLRGDAAPRSSGCGDAVAEHIRVALEHAHAGRSADALREARAALFHDPGHLYSRLLVGQHLIGVDAPRGREVLRDLLASAAALPRDAEVPCAEGLSVAQIEAVARLLLERPEAA